MCQVYNKRLPRSFTRGSYTETYIYLNLYNYIFFNIICTRWLFIEPKPEGVTQKMMPAFLKYSSAKILVNLEVSTRGCYEAVYFSNLSSDCDLFLST